MDSHDRVEMQLRAIRIIETRARGLDGDLPLAEVNRLLALELAEVDSSLQLMTALSTVAAAMLVAVEEAVGLPSDVLLAKMRAMLADAG